MQTDKSLTWSITVALSGFLFGFDTVVISGANLPIKELWETGPIFHGFFIMSMALWGTVIGALLGGIPCDKYGRKTTLFWIGVLYAVSAFGSALAPDPFSFSFFRFLGGLGVGASSIAAPMYISEIAPPEKRGSLVARYQFMLVTGILVAFVSNYFLEGFGGDNDWRYMLGIEGIPAVIYTFAVLGVPNSPRWLVLKRNDEIGANAIMQQLGVEDPDKVIHEIKSSVITKSEKFFSGKFNKPILLAFFLAAFNQLSGINFILYFAPEILELAGLASKESLFNSIAIGGVNFVFTYVGLYFIDKLGRKTLLIIGSLGYILGLSMVSYAFYSGASPTFLLIFLLLFIAAHAVGQGAIIWVYISEIFPNTVRASGQSWGSGTHWVFAALITLFSPKVIELFKVNPWPIFAIFAGFMFLQLIFAVFFFPETKGKSLEELELLSE